MPYYIMPGRGLNGGDQIPGKDFEEISRNSDLTGSGHKGSGESSKVSLAVKEAQRETKGDVGKIFRGAGIDIGF